MNASTPRPIIDGVELHAASLGTYDLVNPANEDILATVPRCGAVEAAAAARHALEGFCEWSVVSPFERSKVLRGAAELMRAQVDVAAAEMTLEQGKPTTQARAEWLASADLLEWMAEEGRRTYGRLIPSRAADMRWAVERRPVGPVAGFSPWNFPAWTPMQKIAPALAAGCSIVLKPAEETPSTACRIAHALLAAGLPRKAIAVIWGDPAAISATLIDAPEIRKISLTGSTRVGRLLAAAAGDKLKKVTMELGGHNPVIIARDARLADVVPAAVDAKFRNAGQVCVSPTRFLVEEPIYADFVAGVRERTRALVVGNGADAATQVGPLAIRAQLDKIEQLTRDAVERGAVVEAGGARVGNRGFFFAPTVLSGVDPSMRAMNDEPFGPLMLVMPVKDIDAALAEANRLPVGLAAYAFTNSNATEQRIASGIKSGMLAVNHYALAMPETPFGGVLDSGIGSEGGCEGLEAFLTTFTHSTRTF